MSSNSTTLYDDLGNSPDWIELYNGNDTEFDLTGFGLSDNINDPFKWVFPSIILNPESYLLIFASGEDEGSNETNLHTNFKIASEGEMILLTNSAGEIVDLVDSTAIPRDISYGRQPDGSDNWLFFSEPTPQAPNNTEGFGEYCETPQISHQGGFYSGTVIISLSINSDTHQIYYTLEGSMPIEDSFIYSQPVTIQTTKVLRAAVIDNECFPGEIITHSYLIDEESNLPTVSLTTDPYNLWDEEYGIYVMGNDASPEEPHYGANFWEDWERPIHVELFEPNGDLGFRLDAGVKIVGGWSRGFPQKSLAIYARPGYGTSEINYQIFPDKEIDSFVAIVLRNSGNDWFGNGEGSRTMFRDGMHTSLMDNTGVEHQEYRPAAVYINGEYWGIHNIREKVNEEFLASNNPGVDPDELDELSAAADIIEGDNQDYLNMIDFISSNSLADPDNYLIVEEQVNIENFIDHNIIHIYIGNVDWPGNNIKFWRPHIEGAKWKWILYDTDFGFGLFSDWASNVYHNTLLFALDDNGPGWPNPPWSTLLFRSLMENVEFQNKFINHFCYYLSTRFEPGYVENHISDIVDNIALEMPNHISRWGGNMGTWNQSINFVQDFGALRADIVFNHVGNYFGLNESSNLNLSVVSSDAGSISVSGMSIPENTWYGEYFNDIPIEISAISNPGYIFSHWAGSSELDEDITVTLDGDMNLTAVFVEDDSPGIAVFINEILTNNDTTNTDEAGEFDDWIELYNAGMESGNTGGLFLTDNAENLTKWMIPVETMIEPQKFLLIWCDEDQGQGELHTNFKLSGEGESLLLVDFDGLTILDSISFGPQSTDISYGRVSEDSDEWQFFDDPTPGASNFTIDDFGDLNGDSIINIFDLVLIVNLVLDQVYNSSADLNEDNSVDILDVVQLVNIIFGDSQLADATSAQLSQKDGSFYIAGNGYIAAVHMILSHDINFSINLTDSAMVSEYRTNGDTTTLIVVAPTSEKIFTTLDSYEIDEVIVMNSNDIININRDFGFSLNAEPTSYSLSQAYPNPFNPTTTLRFSLPEDINVILEVYDINGRSINILQSALMEDGYHSIVWDANSYASGVYFVKMIAGEYVNTQKLMLIK